MTTTTLSSPFPHLFLISPSINLPMTIVRIISTVWEPPHCNLSLFDCGVFLFSCCLYKWVTGFCVESVRRLVLRKWVCSDSGKFDLDCYLFTAWIVLGFYCMECLAGVFSLIAKDGVVWTFRVWIGLVLVFQFIGPTTQLNPLLLFFDAFCIFGLIFFVASVLLVLCLLHCLWKYYLCDCKQAVVFFLASSCVFKVGGM